MKRAEKNRAKQVRRDQRKEPPAEAKPEDPVGPGEGGGDDVGDDTPVPPG